MAKYTYPAVFTAEKDGYSINFPDLENCFTSGTDVAGGKTAASDVLGLVLYWMEKDGAQIPAPSAKEHIPCEENQTVELIPCDTEWYRTFYG